MASKLYMIPCPIVEGNIDSLSKSLIDNLHHLDHFIVERAKTARRFLKTVKHPKPIQEIVIFELDKYNPEEGLNEFLQHLKKGLSIGVISEAGCPGIADPGAHIVDWAHKNNIDVIPLIGPSSIFLALMASGMSGQHFCFHGYLPAKKPELGQKLRQLEKIAQQNKSAQIFMETPYRNKMVFETACQVLSNQTKLCIACNINANDEWIKTKTISEWKNFSNIDIHKKPSIFIIGN